jgi:hypothetical protein
MPSSVDLVCVDPKRVHEVWPHVKHLIHAAILRTNLNHTSDIEYEILQGDGLLWLAWNGQQIKAAASTVLVETDFDKVCLLTACGGEDMAEWLPLLLKIEDYAKAEGCACVRICGRKGWGRVLTGYHVEHIILEKDLH